MVQYPMTLNDPLNR